MRVLLVQLLAEVLQEQPHHRRIAVVHGEADPDVAQLVHRHYQRDTRLHILGFDRLVPVL